jgi:hypothetical protein
MFKYLTGIICFITASSFDQNGIVYCSFTNASFESDIRKESIFPNGWTSQSPNNTPDILPGAWGLDIPAHHGKTCLGLVSREDGSSENIGQELPKTLKSGECYSFSVYLSHADYYVRYDRPCRLKVWGGARAGDKQVLLATSPLINHKDWKQYDFKFTPTQNCAAITFEATYAPGVSIKYKGNILLDKCSDIFKCEKA